MIFAFILALCLSCPGPAFGAAAVAPIVLGNGAFSVSIDSLSLETKYRDGTGPWCLVSKGILEAAGEVQSKAKTSAVIYFPDRALTVHAELAGSTVLFEFSTEKPGSVPWPSIPLTEAENLIWPMADGRYVSVKDAEWMDYLRGGRDLGTGLPAWGYTNSAGTVAWTVETPFRNELWLTESVIELRQNFLCRSGVERKTVALRVGSDPLLPAFLLRDRLEALGKFKTLEMKLLDLPQARRGLLPGALQAYLWGKGVSPDMIAELKRLGIDRALLTVDEYSTAPLFKETAKACGQAGYLFGIYDSYNSIHPASWKGSDQTWSTAQFSAELYETGGMMTREGSYLKGFQGKGRILSPLAARKYFLARVKSNLSVAPLSSYFMDCDAAGEISEDWNPLHPSSSEEIQASRASRLDWLRAEKGLVVGSEGGDALTMGSLMYSEGLFGPVFYWEDPDFKNRESKYFNGAYWPPEAPKVYFKAVPLKEKFVRRYFDPRTRIPLFEAVFHDSAVLSNHWGADPFKFQGQEKTVQLLQALYQTAPSYNLNPDRLREKGAIIKSCYDFLQPLAEKFHSARMISFAWLSPDRLVQKTVYDGGLEIIVNFSGSEVVAEGLRIAAQTVVSRIRGGEERRFTPKP